MGKWDKYDLDNRMASSIRCSIKEDCGGPWEDKIDYDWEELKKHLEAKFDEKMNWDNYGRTGWHVDHIVPKAKFNYDSPEDEEFQKCWSLRNLQPLWFRENESKGKRTSGLKRALMKGVHLEWSEGNEPNM